jgi:hypothetical protein
MAAAILAGASMPAAKKFYVLRKILILKHKIFG